MVYLVDAAKRTVRQIAAVRQGFLHIKTSPNLPLAVLAEYPAPESDDPIMLQVIDTTGKTINRFPMPPRSTLNGWYQDQIVVRQHNPPDGERDMSQILHMDSRTGKTVPFSGVGSGIREAKEPPKPPLKIVQSEGKVSHKDSQFDLLTFWVEGATPESTGRALLTPNGSHAIVLTRGIVYAANGALYVAPIERLDGEAYLAWERDQKRQQALSHAKQLGLGMLMFALDNNETFPEPNSGTKDKIMPYLKNEAIFTNPMTGKNDFVWAYSKSTRLEDIQFPAESPMGYFNGPGGRVVVYMDGHAKWVTDP